MRLKTCSKCKRELEINNFYINSGTKDKLCGSCKECYAKHYCKYYLNNRVARLKYLKEYVLRYGDRVKKTIINSRYKYNYGITTEERNQMAKWQGNRCAICGIKENGRKLCVDHNHVTGQIGMLLCDGCNLGRSCRDNIIITTAYLEYLKTYHT